MALKLTEFMLKGDALQLHGYLDITEKPRFEIGYRCEAYMNQVIPEDMNPLIKFMQDELYDMKIPEPVKCEDGSTYCFARDSVIERFMKDNAEEVQGDDRAQEGPSGREDAQ